MKRKTIIYGMVGGVGPVGSAPQQNPSDYINPKLQEERDRVSSVADFSGNTESPNPRSLKGRVKEEGVDNN